MRRRTTPTADLEIDLDAAEDETERPPRARRAPDHTPAHLRFTHRDSGEFIGSRPYVTDRGTWKRFIRGCTDLRGAFDVEVRNKNQSIIDRTEIDVPADETAAAPATSSAAASSAQSAKTSEVVSEITNTVKALNDLSAAVASKEPTITREDVKGIVRGEVRDSLSEVLQTLRPTAQAEQPRSLVDQAREIKEAAAVLGIERQEAAPRAEALDPQTQLGVLLLRQSGAFKDLLRNAREAFGAVERADAPEGLGDKLIGLARDYAPYVGPVAGPIIGQLLHRAIRQQQGQRNKRSHRPSRRQRSPIYRPRPPRRPRPTRPRSLCPRS